MIEIVFTQLLSEIVFIINNKILNKKEMSKLKKELGRLEIRFNEFCIKNETMIEICFVIGSYLSGLPNGNLIHLYFGICSIILKKYIKKL